MSRQLYIRPLFTCGVFNAKAQTALMYNTARGECHSFEGVSALLVRELLATPREDAIDTRHIASVTGTTIDDVEAFLHDSLLPIGLVNDQITRRSSSWQRSMQVLEELAQWPVPLNIKTPVFRLNTRTYYGARRKAQALSAENEITCGLMPGADGDVSIIEHLQPRPDALRIILMDPRQRETVPADGHADGYEIGQTKGFPCSANAAITVTPTGVVKGCGNISIFFGRVPQSPLKAVICSEQRQQLIHSEQQRLMPGCGAHDYCRYCRIPCFAGKKYEHHADGSIAFEAKTADDCLLAKVRMEVSQQLRKKSNSIGGQTVEACLAVLPVEEVPVFRKKIVK